MNTVQEIEAALSRLPREDFQSVERWIAEFKRQQELKEPYAYAMQEYGVTAEALDRFDSHMKVEIEADRQAWQLREFTGNLEKDLED